MMVKVELNKTEIRTLIASLACRAAYTHGGSYVRFADGLYTHLQELIGEAFDFDNKNWFYKSDKPTHLKWGIYWYWREAP
jgi:hypothetical protein